MNICATKEPGLLSYWANCNCESCVWMKERLAAAGNPQIAFDKPLGPEKGQSRQEYIEQTVGHYPRGV